MNLVSWALLHQRIMGDVGIEHRAVFLGGLGPLTVVLTAVPAFVDMRLADGLVVIIHAFITRASSVMILNQRRWQSLGKQHWREC